MQKGHDNTDKSININKKLHYEEKKCTSTTSVITSGFRFSRSLSEELNERVSETMI